MATKAKKLHKRCYLGDKSSNSNQEERIALLKHFIRLFGKQNIDFVAADQKFIGEKW